MTAIPPPPPPPILYGTQIRVGPGVSTVLADCDFETYSQAGFHWCGPTDKKPLGHWVGPPGAAQGKKGLGVIGVRAYAEHWSTEVLTFKYDLKDGHGKRTWKPGMPNPQPLFDHFAQGKLCEAHNAGFEQTIWEQVCVPKYGWPSVNPSQWRCSAAKSRAFGLPGALGEIGQALNLPTQKDAEGKRLLKLFSWPKDPTKKDPRWRVLPAEEPVDAAKLDDYCETDIETESQASARCPDLQPNELAYWLADQRINRRGIGVDMDAVRDCMFVVDQVLDAYDEEMFKLIGLRTSQAKALVEWLARNGVAGSDGRPVKSLAAEELEFLYEQRDQYPHPVGRVLEIRGLTASASVKKVFAMANHASRDARLCDLFIYHGARTGRDTHADVQPGNLPKAGPNLRWCDDMGCRRPYSHHMDECPWCGASSAFSSEASPVEGDKGWCFEGVDHVLEILQMRSMHALEHFFGDVLLCVSGVVRSLLVAREGHRLICSDYSSIEAVVSAVLTGEEWRVEAFRRREDIYLHGAAGVTGRTYEWYMANGGKKHPDRQKIGKPAELGLGFGGFSGALFAFGFEGEKKEADRTWMAWRAASPAFEEMWGGQYRGVPWDIERREYFGLEGCAVQAVLSPGQVFFYRGITYQVIDDVLYCTLLSGRRMAYHQPRLWYGAKRDGWVECYSLTYMTWNTNAKMGPRGWVRMETYGGRLFENVVQATARDIMAHAVVNLEAAGYPVVLRVHDEVAAEVPNGFGSLEEFERILTDLPDWAKGWPIRAAGWEGVRYHKD
jgi:DNA polymerase